MRSLVVTTGKESDIDIWLKNLRDPQRGAYDGDILIVDFFDAEKTDRYPAVKSFSPETVEKLEADKKIIHEKVHRKYACLATDRMRAFHEVLEPIWSEYDNFVITDVDVHFLKPVEPLLARAASDLSIVKMHSLNRLIFQSWSSPADFPTELIKELSPERAVDCGVIAGPGHKLEPLLRYIIENAEKYTWHYGSDQLSLNLWVYILKKPAVDMGVEWDCQPALCGYYMTTFFKIEGCQTLSLFPLKSKLTLGEVTRCKVKTFEDGEKDICILHAHTDSFLQHAFPRKITWLGPVTENMEISINTKIGNGKYEDFDVKPDTKIWLDSMNKNSLPSS